MFNVRDFESRNHYFLKRAFLSFSRNQKGITCYHTLRLLDDEKLRFRGIIVPEKL